MRNLHVGNRNGLIQGLKNLWAKKYIKNILYAKDQISITLFDSDMCDLHTPAGRPETFGEFSGLNFPFSDSKKTPQQPFGAAALVSLSGEPLISKTLSPKFIITISLPNTIHGCKQLNIRTRKR